MNPRQITPEYLIAFEEGIKSLWEAGELRYLLHLCGGNERELIDVFAQIIPGDFIFSTHRSHYHALLAGIPAEKLEATIRRGDSMFVFDREHRFLTSSVLAGTCGIAAGVAWAIKEAGGKEKVFCFVGDGAEDEGHFYEAVAMVAGHRLPCTFVIEDNDRSVDTNVFDRRGGRAEDWPFKMRWPDCVMRYSYKPTYPHAGSGCKHHIEFKA